jgi:hypothetical protein
MQYLLEDDRRSRPGRTRRLEFRTTDRLSPSQEEAGKDVFAEQDDGGAASTVVVRMARRPLKWESFRLSSIDHAALAFFRIQVFNTVYLYAQESRVERASIILLLNHHLHEYVVHLSLF